VAVNQVKDKRARLIKYENGESKTIGWVSLRGKDGSQLMAQLNF